MIANATASINMSCSDEGPPFTGGHTDCMSSLDEILDGHDCRVRYPGWWDGQVVPKTQPEVLIKVLDQGLVAAASTVTEFV